MFTHVELILTFALKFNAVALVAHVFRRVSVYFARNPTRRERLHDNGMCVPVRENSQKATIMSVTSSNLISEQRRWLDENVMLSF